MGRFRHKNAVQTASLGAVYEQNIKPGLGCTGSPSWVEYYADNSSKLYGHVEYMVDEPHNAPRRKLGTAGYTFNSMFHGVLDVPLGGGTNWQVQNTQQSCVGQGPYYINYRRRERGLPFALKYSGLDIVGFANDVIDLGQYNLPWAEMQRMKDLVSTSVQSKRGRGSDTNLWESVAEVNKTLGTIAGSMDGIRRVVNTAFSSRRRKALSLSDDAAAAYLTTRYGYMPLVKDIFSTLLALNEDLGRRVERTRAQETSMTMNNRTAKITDVNTFDFNCSWQTEETLVVRAVSVDEYVLTTLQRFGLGYKNLVTVPWELTKLSFVVDWFANVGDFIGAIVPNLDLHHIGGCTSTHFERKTTFVASSAGITPSQATAVSQVSGPNSVAQTQNLKYYFRDSALSAPSIRIKPNFKFDQALRAADAITLLLQQFKPYRNSISRNFDQSREAASKKARNMARNSAKSARDRDVSRHWEETNFR